MPTTTYLCDESKAVVMEKNGLGNGTAVYHIRLATCCDLRTRVCALLAVLLAPIVAAGQQGGSSGAKPGGGDSSAELPAGAIARCGNLKLRRRSREPVTWWSSPPAAISSDGRRVATSGQEPRTIDLWDAATGGKVRTIRGFTGEVRLLDYSADGRRLASVIDEGRREGEEGEVEQVISLRVWEVSTGRQAYSIADRSDRIGNAGVMAFSPDGRWLASVSMKGTVDVARVKDGKIVRSLSLAENLWQPSLYFSADGRRIAAIDSSDSPFSPSAFRIWAVDDGEVVASWYEQEVVDDPPYSVWRDASSKKRFRMARRARFSYTHYVALSPSFRRAAVRYADVVLIVDLESGKDVNRIPSSQFYDDAPVRFSPDGKQLALETKTYENKIRFFDVETGRELGVLRGHGMPIRASWFSRDGGTLLATTDHRVYVWDVKTRKLRPYCDGHEIVTKVAFSPNGRFVASEGVPQVEDFGTTESPPVPKSGDGVRIWDAETGRQRFDFGARHGVSFTPDGKATLTWSTDGRIRLHSLETGKTKQTYRLKTWDGKSPKRYSGPSGNDLVRTDLLDLRTTADAETFVYSITDRQIALFERTKGRFRFFPRESGDDDKGDIQLVGLSRDGGTVLAIKIFVRPVKAPRKAKDDRLSTEIRYRLSLYDARTGKRQLAYLPKKDNPLSATFSPDGKLVAVWCEPRESFVEPGEIHIVDAANGRLLRTIAMKKPLYSMKSAGPQFVPFAFSPDGKLLATGADATVRLWDVKTGKRVHEFAGHLGYVTTVAFSDDGTRLASGSMDGTVLVWDAEKVGK